jgi:hypothetical protein
MQIINQLALHRDENFYRNGCAYNCIAFTH